MTNIVDIIKVSNGQSSSEKFGDYMNKNISNMLETVGAIFEATNTVIDTMKDGERIQLKELAQTVGLAVAMEPKHVLGFVNHFVHNSDIAFVTRGKNGGVIKGLKTAKLSKTNKSSVIVSDPSIQLVESMDDLDK